MAKTGSIQSISGPVTARTPLGEVRELLPGEYVYENELIETPAGSFVTILLDNGKTIHLSESSKVLLDDSVLDQVDPYDAIVHEVEMLQKLIESGAEIDDAELETSLGVADDAFEYDVDYHGGDATRGQVGSRQLDVEDGPGTPPPDPLTGTYPPTASDGAAVDTAGAPSPAAAAGSGPAGAAVNVTLSQTFPTVAEGATATYTISVDNAPATPFSVEVIIGHGTTADGDLLPVTRNITVPAGATSVNFTVTNLNDAVAEGMESYAVSLSGTTSGGGYGSVTVDTTTIATTITDTVDVTTISLSAEANEVEGGTITYTATIDNTSDTDLTVNLSNGASITILAGATFGTVDVAAPADDVHLDAGTVSVSIAGTAGGNFESLVIDPTTADTAVADTVDDTTVSLTATAAVTEGGNITYTAALDNAADGDMAVTLNDGTVITILDGNTTGAATIAAPVDDAFIDAGTVTNYIASTTGGNFENVINANGAGTPVSTTITDTVDVTTVALSAEANEVEGGTITYTVTVDNTSDTDLTVNLSNGATITILAGGNFESLVVDATAATTAIADTVDTATVTLTATGAVAEGGNITYTATVDNAPSGSDLVLDLDNGSQITILAGSTTGNVTVAAPTDDAFVDAGNVTVAITGAAGGNFEDLDTTDTATTAITDTVDVTNLTLAAEANEVEGGTITYTATVDNVSDSDLTVNLSNGASITILAGATFGTVDVAAPADDVYVDAGSVSATITGTAGGNFESLVVDATAATTAIADTVDTSTVTLSQAASTVAEGGSATYTVSVDNAPDTDFDVEVITGHTTTDDGDLVPTTTTVTILAGSTSTDFTVSNVDDVITEGNEDCTVALTGTTSGGNFENVSVDTTALTTTIVDDEGLPSLTVNDVTVDEDAGNLVFTVTLSNVAAADVTFDFNSVDVDATAGDDYTAVTGTATITAGSTTTTISVPISDDVYQEGSETFNIALSNPSANAIIADGSGLGTIDDTIDTTTVALAATGSVAEGGTITYTATLTNAADGDVTVNLSNGATITILDGATTGTVDVTASDDVYAGGDSASVTIASASGGNFENLAVDATAAVTTITDDADTTTVSLSQASSTVAEGGSATYTVSVDNAPDTDFDVEVITGHTTTDNGDLVPTTSTVTILAGTTSVDFTVSNVDDVITEGNEDYTVALTGTTSGGNFENVSVDTTALTTTITDDDFPPALDLDADDSSAAGADYATIFTEGGGGVAIADSDIAITDIDDTNIESATITITNVETDDLLIVGSLPAAITAGAYDAATGTITLIGTATLADYQQAIRAIQFDNVGDSVAASRTINVTVNDGDNDSNTAVSTVNIVTVPTVSIDDVSVQEPDSGTTTLTFTVSIDQTLGSDLTFDYQTVDVSALAGSDYVGIGTTTGTITAGSTSTTISVTINSDADVFEGDEAFTVDLANFNQTVNFQTGAHLTTDGIQGIGSIGVDSGPPVAVDDAFITTPDTPLVTGDVLANDALVDNAVYSAHDGTSVNGGTVTYNGDGTFTYTPAGGFSGTDTFTYTVIDDDGETDTATVTVEVSNAVINPPSVSAVPDTAYTENDAITNILTGITMSDVDSTTLSKVVVKIDGYIGSQDVLAYLTAGTSVNASISVSGSTWELTLTNGADINEYETVLDSLTYENTSDNPSASTRNITVEAYDETYNNLFSSDTGSLNVLPVNDAPEVFDNNAYAAADSLDNGLNITMPTDPDTDDADLVITVTGLPPTLGTVTLADGTAVNVGDTLTRAELAGLQFDAGSADGTEQFTYSVFDGDQTTVGTTTINVGDTDPDTGTVYESALADGTGADDGASTVSGNLFANDASAGNSIDSVDFGASNYTPAGGVITINTTIGTLTVYADNSTPGYSSGDYVYELTAADGSGNDVTEAFTYNFDSGGPLSDTLTITVEDDEPIARDLEIDVPESEEQVFNLMLTLDDSGSMSWGAVSGSNPPGAGEASRMDIAKEALSALAQEFFKQSSQVTVTLITFNTAATFVGSYTTFENFETDLLSVTPGGGTNYVDATDEIMTQMAADLAAQNPADDVQNISYFISDGEPNAGTSAIGSGYIEYVNANSIDSYAVGIGSSLPSDLSDLNYIHNIDSLGSGYGAVDPALIVEDVSMLQSELLSTVPTAFGGNITVDVDASIENVLFGADTGYVDSITIDLGGTDYTFTYDGSTITVPGALAATVEVDGALMTLDADDGFAYGTIKFNFADGSYTISAPNGLAPSSFDFDFTIVDGDGDTAGATATINIVDDAPEARDDLHSVVAGEVAEGNVVTAIGTDGGPSFGLDYTPFATQGGGVDKVVDDAAVSEFTYKGETISLDLTLSTPPAPAGGSESLAINNTTNWTTTNIALSANAGFNAGGAGVTGGRDDGTFDNQDGGAALTVSFDGVDLPYGVDNLILTINDFQSANNDEVTIAIYDTTGATLGTAVQAATTGGAENVDLSAYTGIGSVDIVYTGGGWDSQLSNVAFDPAPGAPTLDQTGGDNGSNLTWVYSYDYDLDGNPVFDATVTDSDDNTTFTMRSNGYYSYTPDMAAIPAPVTVSESFTDGSADQGVAAITTANGSPVITWNGANGIGVNSTGDTYSDSANAGDNIIFNFDPVLYPNGIEEITMSFGWDSGTGSAIFYDDVGAVIDTVALTGANSQTFSGITGVYSMEIATGADGDYSVTQIDFTVVPDPVVLPTTLDPILVDYVLTDNDDQSDSAQLAIYTIDNEITGTIGADSITGGALNDAIIGDTGDDILAGGAGADTLSGDAGQDYLSGGADDDILSGGADEDNLDGDAGDDIVDGGTGDDIVKGGTGDDQVFGGAGDDRLEGEDGDDALYGGAGSDTLEGGDGADTLDGGDGADTISGGKGDDTIVLDENDTSIDGGAGDDTLMISHDVLDFSTIADGTISNVEKLDLNDSDAQSVSLNLDDVLDMTDGNNTLEVTGGAGDEVTFEGVQGPGADWTHAGGGLFTHSNGVDQVQIVTAADPDNQVKIFTDDGTEIT